jgi:TolA-binding protein
MDAGYKKDYAAAAGLLRYSYYQSRDSYRFFWYLHWLSMAGMHGAIEREAEGAPEEMLHHRAYGSGAARLYVQALQNQGKREKALGVLVELYKKYPEADTALILVSHFWNSEKAGPLFIGHPGHDALLRDIMERFGLIVRKEHEALASALFEHCVVAASTSAMRSITEPEAMKEFDFRCGEFKRLCEAWKADTKTINRADALTMIKVFDFFRSNPPSATRPYRFIWLNIYVPGISAPYLKNGAPSVIERKISPEEASRRISDLGCHYNAVSLFYYFLTGGQILMKPRFETIDAQVTRTEYGTQTQPGIMESVRPYPSRLIYEGFRSWDGLMWWYPHYESAPYLGGAKHVTFVPGLLRSEKMRMFAKMTTGASWRVLVHEIHHNFGYFCGVPSGHEFSEKEKARWPSWYAAAVKENGNRASELLWYQQQIFRKGNSDGFAALKSRNTDWMPDASAFSRALALSESLDPRRAEKAEELLKQAAAEEKKGNTARQMELLDRAGKEAPEMQEILFKKAYAIHFREKNFEKAVPLYEEYLARYGGFENSDAALTYLITWHGQRDAARALLLLDKYGNNPVSPAKRDEFTLWRAKILKRLGRKADALRALAPLLSAPAGEKRSLAEELAATLR